MGDVAYITAAKNYFQKLSLLPILNWTEAFWGSMSILKKSPLRLGYHVNFKVMYLDWDFMSILKKSPLPLEFQDNFKETTASTRFHVNF